MEAKSSEWVEMTQARIKEAFDLFDHEGSGSIIQVILIAKMDSIA